jgi:methyl-accepting chemotaxis protein
MKDIAGRIAIVEEIARQTDLLALNAAIEAPRRRTREGFRRRRRRGPQARRAQPPGRLGDRPASGTSVAVAEQAGSLIERLVPRIRETAKLVQDIAAASAEQNTGSGQLKTAVQSLDKVIQQNAAAAEQMAAAAPSSPPRPRSSSPPSPSSALRRHRHHPSPPEPANRPSA